MPKRLEEILAELPPARRARIERETKKLIAEEMALRDLRNAVALTQTKMGKLLGIGQDSVSRLEQRCDLLVSTLRGYIEATGGRLRLIAELPDRPAIELVGLSTLIPLKRPAKRSGVKRSKRPKRTVR